MKTVLKTYYKRLTNLSADNRALFLPRLFKSRFLDLHALDFAFNKPSFSIISDLLLGKKEIPICDETDPRDEKTNIASLQLKQIRRATAQICEESGANNLFVGFLFAEGKFNDGTPLRCPLLFFPVDLDIVRGKWVLRLRDGETLVFNKTFLLAYAHYNQLRIDDEVIDATFDDFMPEARSFYTQLYQFLEKSPLDLNFNPELFEEKLKSYFDSTKIEFLNAHRTGEIKLHPQAVLGIFPQADSYLAPDYETLLGMETPDMEAFFAPKTNTNAAVSETNTVTPFELDASQESALIAVKSGKSIVVQGPPGTGKSQLICNLVADGMAAGKRVLVVCQKRAALDVVYKRLKDKELHTFAALLHDFLHDRKTIYEQLLQQLDALDHKLNNPLNLAETQHEAQFFSTAREIEKNTRFLNDFKNALFDTTDCGLSVKELYLTSSLSRQYINISSLYQHFKFNENYTHFLSQLDLYEQYATRLETDNYLLKNRVSFANFSLYDLPDLKKTVNNYEQQTQNIKKELQTVGGFLADWGVIHTNIKSLETLKQIQFIFSNPKVHEIFLQLFDIETITEEIATHLEHKILSYFDDPSFQSISIYGELEIYRHGLEKYINTRKNIFTRLKWLFSKEKKQLKRFINLDGLDDFAAAELRKVKEVLLTLNESERLCEMLVDYPQSFEKQLFSEFFKHLKQVLLAKKLIADNQQKHSGGLATQLLETFKNLDHLRAVITSTEKIITAKSETVRYLSEQEMQQNWNKTLPVASLVAVLESDFEWLCAYDALQTSFNEHEKQIVKLLQAVLLSDSVGLTAKEIFDNSLRLAWIEHLERQNPILKAVSLPDFEQTTTDLRQLIIDKQNISKLVAQAKSFENVYKQLEYNRLGNLLTYRELKHQLNKKRNIFPLRKLLAMHLEEIFRLLPCWLASPEMVSAVFPMQTELFDLVIFDEASQCFAEKGIPALYRAKQVVIAGDNKQLQPFDLYRTRWEDETDDDIALEIESLLDVGNYYLPSTMLTGHYRSQARELIYFSNQYFYDHKLQFIPDNEHFINQEPAIAFLKVDGIWENQCNEIEAEKVIEVLQNCLNEGHKNIGVITFNQKQQQLILDLLESKKIYLPDTVFVKNIENVQGDEKDIIIFSVGYAPSPSGRLAMQFGNLNQKGGENRLNVAITRAKAKIMVVSSIFPAQLQVEGLQNDGAKLLKKYLEYAYQVAAKNYVFEVPTVQKQQVDWYLKNKLKSATIIDDLPFSDLVEYQNQVPKRLLFTDDNLLYESTIKDFFAYRYLMLQKKHWSFETVFSRNFWLQTKNEL